MKDKKIIIKIIIEKIFKKKVDIKKVDQMGLGKLKKWDSLKHFYFLLSVEKEFNVKFSALSFSKLRTVKQILTEINKIEKK